MFHCRVFFLCTCTFAHSVATLKSTRADLSACHPMLDFSHVAQYWKLDSTQHVSFLQDLGCEIRSNPSPESQDYTCGDGAFACVAKVPNANPNDYMCCNIKYSSRSGPRITNMLGESLDVWRAGLSTLVQIPKAREVAPTLLVQINVQPYAPYWYTMGCEDGRIAEVLVSGTSLGESNVTVRSGALHANESFAVRVGDGLWQELSWRTAVVDQAVTFVSSPSMMITGVITATDPQHWGPDASAVINVGGLSITVQQHTLGSADEGKPMLDVGVNGAYSKSQGVGGLLGPDGTILVQGTAPVPCMTIDASVSA
uniref:Uncharacterized protein n=1 Tax=Noctiluca scintillans TaxID=2966 RepID=A0A7S1ANJ2_NOCSC|mmetsp:Transcript_52090/g.138822  ORF Transcript_52090/g.138822 Transcript_52090/m.138822 type:complete len:312 (+) Transcript_52090:72-1007(+)